MCSLRYGVFIFFGAFQFLALLYNIFLQPETCGVPIEEAANVVRAHWLWRRVAYPGKRKMGLMSCRCLQPTNASVGLLPYIHQLLSM